MFGKTGEKCSHTLCHMLKNSKKADKLIIKTLYIYRCFEDQYLPFDCERHKNGKMQERDKRQKMINEK